MLARMTVAAVSTETLYALSGTTLGPFNTVWPYASPGDVTCQLDYGDGTGAHLLVQGADYMLTASGPTLSAGGQITLAAYVLSNFGAAWAAGAQLMLARLTPRSQPSAFGEAVGFSPQASEQALDNVERQVQEMSALLGQALMFPPGDPCSGMLPGTPERNGLALMFDPVTGCPYAGLPPGGGGSPAPPAAGLAQFVSIAALRALGSQTYAIGDAALVGSFDGSAARVAGGGLFRMAGTVAATGLADDGGTVIVSGPNVWLRDQQAASATAFGAVGDGVTDDSDALQAWFNCGATSLVLPPAKNKAVGYLIKKPLVATHNYNQGVLSIYCGAKITAGAGFPAGKYMILGQLYFTTIYHMKLDGGINGNTNFAWGGFSNGDGSTGYFGFQNKYIGFEITHCYGRHFGFENGNDTALIECNIFQWNGSDAPFGNQANFTADGIYTNYHDNRVVGGTVHNCGINYHAASGGGTTWCIGTHFYQGPWPPYDVNGPFVNPVNVQLEIGSGSNNFIACYWDNGVFNAFSSAFRIVSGNWIASTASNNDVFLRIYCDNKNHPYQMDFRFVPQGMALTTKAYAFLPSQPIACASAVGDGTHVTYTIPNWPFIPTGGSGPQTYNLYTFAGWGLAGFNVTRVAPTSVAVLGDGTTATITIANTTTGASTPGSVQCEWSGNYGASAAYTTNQVSEFALSGGRVSVFPEYGSSLSSRVEISPYDPLTDVFSIGNPANPVTLTYAGAPGMNIKSNYGYLQNPVAGGTSIWTVGSNTGSPKDDFGMVANGDGTAYLRLQTTRLLNFASLTSIFPQTNNTVNWGSATNRFATVYGTSGYSTQADRGGFKRVVDSPLGFDFIKRLRPVMAVRKVDRVIPVGQVWRDPWGDEVEEDWQGFRYEDGSPALGPIEIVAAQQVVTEPGEPKVWLDPFGREVPQWQPTCLDEAGVQVWPVQAQAAEALVETVDGYRLEQAFLGDEVKALADQLGIDFGGYRRDAAGDPDSLIYEQFIPPLANAIRELGARIEALERGGGGPPAAAKKPPATAKKLPKRRRA
jgi:hypothetical protein